ncbi:MAG: hypothetical protein KF893_14760 [Caldilineaceae bacterium]|nr:hypothetical protein [Caldilineaceae bacterium]
MVKRIRRTIYGYTPEQRTELGRLVAIGLLGLLLGLFIGWVVWPVERSNAILDDLRPDLRAHYLAALADSYVAAGGQNPEITLARIGQLQNPAAAIADAIRFYQDNPSAASAVAEINLRTLAAALGEEDAIIQSLQGGAAQPGQGIIAAEPEVGWLPWLMVTLTALLLVIGGLWIAYQFLLRRREEEELITDGGVAADVSADNDPYMDTLHQASEAERLAKWRTMIGDDAPPEPTASRPVKVNVTVKPPPLSESTPVVFETEVTVDEDDVTFEDHIIDPHAVYDDDTYDDADDDYADDEDTDDDEEVEEIEESIDDGGFDTAERPRVATYPSPFEETPRSTPDPPAPEAAPPNTEQDEEKPAAAIPPLPGPATEPSQPRKPSTAVSKPTRPPANAESGRNNLQDRLTTFWKKDPPERDDALNRFTAQYQYGIADYDESFIITANNELLGACGMGIDKELDPKAASSDKVQVLDVWFYDRIHLHTYNQLIVSRSMNWDNLTGKVFNSGTVTGDPLVAAPGVTFKLHGKDLILDCRIESVEYLEENDLHAPFRSIVISMTVRQKKG